MNIDSFIRIKNAVENWDTNNTCELHEPTHHYGEPTPSLGFLIKKHLKQQDITQKSLADRVGTSQSRISEYIRGAVVPSLGVASRICKELKIDPKRFIDSCSRL
jgi:antitoxin component HigA of HigAB toxin-antitoxin module